MEKQENTTAVQGSLDDAVKMAQFRFALIAPVVQGLVSDVSSAAYFRRITQMPLTLPDGREVRYEPKTPEKWYYLYRKGGFDALMPKGRSDRGQSRALPDTAVEEIFSLKEKFPRLNATRISPS